MPAHRKNQLVQLQYFCWRLVRRNGIYYADGRSNPTKLGLHSLSVRDRDEALKLLPQLDAKKAVEYSLAPRSILEGFTGNTLLLEEGESLYLEHAGRPAVLGGVAPRSLKRYRSPFKKFLTFARSVGVQSWNAVTRKTLEAYTAWLDDEGYSYATEYTEITTLKQAIKWLVAEKKLPSSCLVDLPLKKPKGTTTYCYHRDEVEAMVAHCASREDLAWIGEVIVALVTTGLRIGELAALRWEDVDLSAAVLQLTDRSFQGSREDRARARTTKSHRSRVLPLHADLHRVLKRMKQHPDGRVFHGPRGGVLKPDTVRNILKREVLTPLASRFPAMGDGKGFTSGRLHSFRHYFCSVSANSGISEQVLMTWLGHQDSKMVRHYYHLHHDEAKRQMAKLPPVQSAPGGGQEAPAQARDGHGDVAPEQSPTGRDVDAA
jgi:integrase